MVTRPFGRTMKAAFSAKLDRPDAVIKAQELVDVRYARGVSPSLVARRTWNLLIQAAAGDGWKNEQHSITKRDLRSGKHLAPGEIAAALEELQMTLIRVPLISPAGKHATLTTALLSSAIEEHSDDDDSRVWFRFTPEICELLRKSNYYAELERLIICAFTSKYAFSIYERAVRELGKPIRRNDSIDIDVLREVIGVEKGTLTRWPDLRRFAIQPAIDEINHLAPFEVHWSPIAKGRRVIGIELTYAPKVTEDQVAAARELEMSKVGRKTRRTKTAKRMDDERQAMRRMALLSIETAKARDFDDEIPEF